MKSITPHIIEEAYELVEAINSDNNDEVKEELGDVLLHVTMLSEIASESQSFDLEAVASTSCEKMIRRHPHVFGDQTAKSVDDVHDHWEKVKSEEKSAKKEHRLFDSIPKQFPALMQSEKLQKKAAKQGFDWDNLEGPLAKIEEEFQELKDEIRESSDKSPCDDMAKQREKLEHEAGDLLFSVANLLRHLKISPEEALRQCNQRFIQRYYKMEDLAKEDAVDFSTLSLEEKERYWEKTKIML